MPYDGSAGCEKTPRCRPGHARYAGFVPRVLHGLIVCLSLLALASCHQKPDPVGELEDRLFSPCCWRQSLRDHESPIATQLRAEIQQRIAAGEAPASIEADFVRRYGEGIRALPSGTDPRWMIGVVVGIGVIAGVVLLVVIFRRRPKRAASVTMSRTEDPDDADRLDDELALVD